MSIASSLVGLDDIRAAAERIAGTCLRTPVVPFVTPEGSVPWAVKAEGLQPTGAFKLRGATNAVALLDDAQRRAGVVTHSSGNHAQAVAYAARVAGVHATIVIPDNAPEVKVAATRRWGADVVMVAPSQRHARAQEIAAETGAALIPPYDDARVIAGQGTVGLEIVEQVPDLATVVVPVSGGGLVSGVAAAVKALRPDVRVVAVEPELAADLAEGWAAGERRVWSVADTSRTVADGLRTDSVGVLNWDHITAYVDDVVTVSEEEILAAVGAVVRGARVVVEPSGAVAAAAVLKGVVGDTAGTTVAIASGANIDPAVLARLV
ncbi:threonine/serine dehydratase [Mumia sp. zg.B53]|uniref:threonine ammonia-lyase n=1 Tax=unclassified Mumia TaxID=2621872 RepID=UPI001C6DF27A|nr:MULTISPECIES: threonine/serine dehydratase [unclassified Mumia]MBW9214055.1 threonine/serine dehydratase [Mumia sp. zg.B53]MDD9348967.1 threonine/serine dehydratase [Mumia sp.]